MDLTSNISKDDSAKPLTEEKKVNVGICLRFDGTGPVFRSSAMKTGILAFTTVCDGRLNACNNFKNE
jgi:hypothetical protein